MAGNRGPLGLAAAAAAATATAAAAAETDTETAEGKSRPITLGDMTMARQLFAASLNYASVRVHKGGCLWFGLDYPYTLDDSRALGDCNMEAQGDILADHFALKFLRNPSLLRNRVGADGAQVYPLGAYERNFIANHPSTRGNLP